MPRFVILQHDYPFLHWDLMLEENGVLKTWRLAEPPGNEKKIPAHAIGDHRLAYLTYEGPVSGNRGQVSQWDFGTFEKKEMVSEGRLWLSISFAGKKIFGQAVLMPTEADQWIFQFPVPGTGEGKG